MSELTVLTLTNGRRRDWLAQCTASVKAQLPADATHEIIVCPNYEETDIQRLLSLNKSKYVAFVDDDDWVINDSLNLCLKAIRETGVGVAFTDEIVMNEAGAQKYRHVNVRREILYNTLATYPQAVHHLAVFRTEPILEELMTRPLGFHSRIEWWMKATAGLKMGAIHVPILGYCWRHHDKGRHVDPREVGLYSDKFKAMKEHLSAHTTYRDMVIPKYAHI